MTPPAAQKEFADASFCEDWKFRLECAARTWNRPHPQEALMCAPTPLAPQSVTPARRCAGHRSAPWPPRQGHSARCRSLARPELL